MNDRTELYKLLIYNEYIINLKYEQQIFYLRKCDSDFIFDETGHIYLIHGFYYLILKIILKLSQLIVKLKFLLFTFLKKI
jgi:hypothetical protein